jgi:hypothetical protein
MCSRGVGAGRDVQQHERPVRLASAAQSAPGGVRLLRIAGRLPCAAYLSLRARAIVHGDDGL